MTVAPDRRSEASEIGYPGREEDASETQAAEEDLARQITRLINAQHRSTANLRSTVGRTSARLRESQRMEASAKPAGKACRWCEGADWRWNGFEWYPDRPRYSQAACVHDTGGCRRSQRARDQSTPSRPQALVHETTALVTRGGRPGHPTGVALHADQLGVSVRASLRLERVHANGIACAACKLATHARLARP